MDITRAGSKPSGKGPADWFTGTVRIDPLFTAAAPARVGGAAVTFEPGARTAWHTHPLGQTLIVTSGVGWVQREGGPVESARQKKLLSGAARGSRFCQDLLAGFFYWSRCEVHPLTPTPFVRERSTGLTSRADASRCRPQCWARKG
jgi:hypothetical protein